MIQIIIIGIFVLLVAYDSKGCDKFSVVCQTVCRQDGDQLGVVIDKKCFCANQRNVDDIFVKVPKHGGTVAEKRKPYIWE